MWMAAFTFASAMVMLAEAFTLMYKTTRVPNYTVGAVATLSAYAAHTGIAILGMPYFTSYLIACVTGVIATLIVSLLVMEPLIKRGRSPVLMTLAMLALGIVIEALVKSYSYWLRVEYGQRLASILLVNHDFNIGDLNFSFLISSTLALSSALAIRHIVTKTRFGVELRAIDENIELAQVQGIDPVRNRIIAWAIAGGLTGLAGILIASRFHVTAVTGSWIMTIIVAASLLSGIDNPRSAVLGGLIMGILDIMLVSWGQAVIGVWVGEFRFVTPMAFIVLLLALKPNGLLGTDVQNRSWRGLRHVTWKRVALALVILSIGGGLFVRACRDNRVKARDVVMEELSGYDVVIRKRERGVTSFNLGNMTVFMGKLAQFNISTVYVEPYTDSSTVFKFYYPRGDVYWRTSVSLEYYGFCQYRARDTRQ